MNWDKFIIVLMLVFMINVNAKDLIENENKLFAFVGEYVDIYEFDTQTSPDVIMLDLGYTAKYKVLKSIYGNYSGEFIEFNAYDHYGFPEFAKFKVALLFVSEENGIIFHQKYQFFDVYKTKGNRWATCGNPYEFEDEIKPKALKSIEFSPSLEFDISRMSKKYYEEEYPLPIFRIIDTNTAICIKGVYADELFEIKQKTVFKARGIKF
jgi:hypothetical protein